MSGCLGVGKEDLQRGMRKVLVGGGSILHLDRGHVSWIGLPDSASENTGLSIKSEFHLEIVLV